MALREQPYLPLYVQDFMTDEKLNECSAAANGVYIRLMCLMHKSETYGQILLKQKYKKIASKNKNLLGDLLEQNCKQNKKFAYYFAYQLQKQMPFSIEEIAEGIEELLDEKVLLLEEETLIQKRMVKDEELSTKRSLAGSKGGKKTVLLKQNSEICSSKSSSKTQAKHENEIEYEIEYENKDINSLINDAENFSESFDPYCSIQRICFDKVYDSVFGKSPVMTNEDCLNLAEVAIANRKDFFRTLHKYLTKTSKLNFKKIGYKPGAKWFLTPKNYADLRNGVYDAQIEGESDNGNGYEY